MDQDVAIPPLDRPGTLTLPPDCGAVVVFAHGCEGGRGPNDRRVAAGLREAGLGTLLVDLLTAEESADRAIGFDVHLLADRLLRTVRWLHEREEVRNRPIGLFGDSIGAAAALVAAARAAEHDAIGALVCASGRPDLAEVWIDGVVAPTLLIVGAADTPVLSLNRQALAALHCVKALEIVCNASHRFQEPGALDAVITSSRAWFRTHLIGAANG